MGQIRLVPPTSACITEERKKLNIRPRINRICVELLTLYRKLKKLGIGMGNESIFAQSIALNNKSLKNKVKEKEPMMRTTEDNYS